MEFKIVLSVLVILLVVQILGVTKKKDFSKYFRYAFIIFSVIAFLAWVIISILQIKAWQSMGPPISFLAPPYGSFLYAFGYHFMRFFLYYLIAFIISLIFLIYSKKLNKESNELFFEKEESYLGATSILLLGSTGLSFGWIYYLLGVILIPFLINSYKFIFKKKDSKFSLRFLWLPVAVLVLIITSF